MVQSPRGDLPWCTALNTGCLPQQHPQLCPPQCGVVAGRGMRWQLAFLLSPSLRNAPQAHASPSLREQWPQVQMPGKAEPGRGCHALPASLGHRLHPPIASVLMGLQLLLPSPTPPCCCGATRVGRGCAVGVPAQQCQPAGCQGALRLAGEPAPGSGHQEPAPACSIYPHFIYLEGVGRAEHGSIPCPRDTSVQGAWGSHHPSPKVLVFPGKIQAFLGSTSNGSCPCSC